MKAREVETIQVPPQFVSLADRRTRALILAAIHYPDALRVIAWSCYLQGVEDGADVRDRQRETEGG